MPWTKAGDNAATYPKLMQVAGLADADERSVNETAGWLLRCFFQSAAHLTDYRIDMGTALMLGSSRTEALIAMCTATGLVEDRTENGVRFLVMLADPEFVHLRLRKEVEWERQQRSDTRDPTLKAPVLNRDGDACRRCAVVVQWLGRASARKGTLGHVHPGQPATVDTLVVECWSCNAARQDNPAWDDDHPLLPAPAAPLYGKTTAAYLTKNGYPTQPNNGDQPVELSDPGDARSTDDGPRPVRAGRQHDGAGDARSKGDGPGPVRAAPPEATHDGAGDARSKGDGPGPVRPAPPVAPSKSTGSDFRAPTERVLSGRVGDGSGSLSEVGARGAARASPSRRGRRRRPRHRDQEP